MRENDGVAFEELTRARAQRAAPPIDAKRVAAVARVRSRTPRASRLRLDLVPRARARAVVVVVVVVVALARVGNPPPSRVAVAADARPSDVRRRERRRGARRDVVQGPRRVLQVRLRARTLLRARRREIAPPPSSRPPPREREELTTDLRTENRAIPAPTPRALLRRDTPRLAADEIATRLASLGPTWTLDPAGLAIKRAFVAKNWRCAIDFVNALSDVAETEVRPIHWYPYDRVGVVNADP